MAPTAPMAYKACSELSMSGKAIPESKQQRLVPDNSSLVFLLIRNLTNGLSLPQLLGTKTTEVNMVLKTDANGAHQ